ncbi:hypothetical protein BN946_scf184568.g4 [Trametes cinnabarina]|uniref:Uncharacterized protein n=1 Tax=Pycnoporus cinnabarinus TaxID=5643 RepID=A0A060SC06_PYCCI|nr:hypothetical protein BN946_scf184568.g4 [Trametes cinnabarina]
MSKSDRPEESLHSILSRALGGVKELERENASLRRKVHSLEAKLDRITAADDTPVPRPKGKGSAALAREEVARLRNQVRRLEKANEKQRKRIHQLSLKELKTEAEDLLDAVEFEASHIMGSLASQRVSRPHARELPRRGRGVHDMHGAPATGQSSKARSSHLRGPRMTSDVPFYSAFLASTRSAVTACGGLHRSEAEPVEFTASQQWDALLDIAKEWAKMDVRREDDTTEEEDAEDFIDDGQEETSAAASEPVPVNPLESSPEPQTGTGQVELPQTPTRLRKRRAITTTSPEPDAELPDGRCRRASARH